jgi:hypothetical protein
VLPLCTALWQRRLDDHPGVLFRLLEELAQNVRDQLHKVLRAVALWQRILFVQNTPEKMQ